MPVRNRIALILPWAGKRPWYWDLWRRSAEGMPFDVIALERPLEFFRQRAAALDANGRWRLSCPYKLCDFKPLYGEMFAEELKGYEYWAFGDCDVLYGARMPLWIRKVLDGGYDVASVQGEFTAGPFTVLRNCAVVNHLWASARNVDAALHEPRVVSFDELGPNWFRRMLYGGTPHAALRAGGDCFSGVVWKAAEEGRLKLLAETVIDERLLRPGETVRPGGDYALFHFIAAKTQFGFSGDGRGVYLSPLRAAGGALAFAGALLAGRKKAWRRVSDSVRCRLDRRALAICGRHLFPNWWRDFTWNNRGD